MIRPRLRAFDGTNPKGWTLEAQLFDAERRPVLEKPIAKDATSILNETYPQRDTNPLRRPAGESRQPAQVVGGGTRPLHAGAVAEGRLGHRGRDRERARRLPPGRDQGRPLPAQRQADPALRRQSPRAPSRPRASTCRTSGWCRTSSCMKRHQHQRGAHQPLPERPAWYDLCDRYGIYLIDEADLETHGFATGRPHERPAVAAGASSTARCAWSSATRTTPAIMLWSLGNESGMGRTTRRWRAGSAPTTRRGRSTTRARRRSRATRTGWT